MDIEGNMFPKIRVYNKIKEKFIIPCELDNYDDIDVTYADGKWYITGGSRMSEEIYRIDLFTGFCDPITYKELYENDKVKVAGHYEGDTWCQEFIGTIQMIEGGWMVIGNRIFVDLWDYVNNYY